MHADEQMYTPELVFGHLYTWSNYGHGDEEETGGRHGLGTKLANLFSTHFRVECLDSQRRKRFRMEWEHNMSSRHEPVVTDVAPAGDRSLARDYTEIAFRPDLHRFGMEGLDKDTVALLTKRVYDIAGCNPSVRVFLNKRRIRLDDFEAYVGLYLNSDPRVPHVFRQIDDRWSVCVALSESGQEFQQVSFVNSVCTSGGGVHVNHVYESLWSKLAPLIDRKNKDGDKVTSGNIAGHVWLFINCRIPKPAFDSQTKEKLMSHRPVEGGALWQLPDDYVRQGSPPSLPWDSSRCDSPCY
jgi:DNA topoisomerase-2